MATMVFALDGGGPKDSKNTLNSFLTKRNKDVFWRFGTDMFSPSVIQVKGQSMSGNDRIRARIRIRISLGLPIAEGALSTILGVFGLAFAFTKTHFSSF